VQSTNDYQDVTVRLPARAGQPRTTVTVTSSKTFQPGATDRRTLGVMIDRWSCAPAAGQFVVPPPRSLRAAAVAGGALGGAVAAITTGVLAPILAIAAIAAAQGVPLAWGFGGFTDYPGRLAWAAGVTALLLAVVALLDRVRPARLTQTARWVAVCTAAIFYLKLIVLLHPSKPPIDVIFHAHRLQWVLDGRWYFTQPMPSGVRFPYAIGLYVFAAPWSWLTNDYALLLRVIVTAAELSGSVLVYLMVARLWNDRLAGAFAAALLPLVPRLFEIVGNANMTNAFGQSAALATVAAAVLWPLDRAHLGRVAAFAGVTAFALLCHISTLTLLSASLLIVAALFWWKDGEGGRQRAACVSAALVVAALFAIVVYYGHFGDAYRTAARVRAQAPATAPGAAETVGAASIGSKIVEAADLSVEAVGWPILLLGAAGAGWAWRRRDRLTLGIAAWMITFAVFTTSVVLMPVERSFQRYAAEFISRVTLSTYPAMVILAGAGAAGLWREKGMARILAIGLVGGAAYVAGQAWIEWLR
jgi:hypothetical protein